MVEQLVEVAVAPGTYHVSAEPILLTAHLQGALALCLHDESREIGGLLHLQFIDATGKPSDVTDNTLNSVLVILDRFKRAVLSANARRDEVHARILAHALPPTDASEPTANLVDLIKADFADARIDCGSQTLRRLEPVDVSFRPFEGRVRIVGPRDLRTPLRASR